MIFDFRLKVFHTVSQKLSFTKAANELFITQPAVTKHINELESQLQVMLFKRNGNSISLTPAGEILERYAIEIFRQYALLENELAVLQNQEIGSICIGASTTVAQYVLPSILARFKKTYPLIIFTFISGNSGFIEQLVINQKVDIALVEGNSHRPQISYEPFVNDEIVLVTRFANKLGQLASIAPQYLKTVPLVLREEGSGTLDVVLKALNIANLHAKDLCIEIKLDTTESIKEYLMHTDAAAFLSIHSIVKDLNQNRLTIIEVQDIEIFRSFQFIRLHGNSSKVMELFQRFCKTHYNLK